MLVPQIARIGNQGKISKPQWKELLLPEKKKGLILQQFKKQPISVEKTLIESNENLETESCADWEETKQKGKKTVEQKTKGKLKLNYQWNNLKS